jgi:hypothetical protein
LAAVALDSTTPPEAVETFIQWRKLTAFVLLLNLEEPKYSIEQIAAKTGKSWHVNTASDARKMPRRIDKAFIAFVRRADEGTVGRLLVEATILLTAARGNAAQALRDTACRLQGGHECHHA